MGTKKKKQVEITFIEVGVRRFIYGIGSIATDRFTVAVMDPHPVVKYELRDIKVTCFREKVDENSTFHKEAKMNSALGRIDWRVAGLSPLIKEFPAWCVASLVKIKREIKYAE